MRQFIVIALFVTVCMFVVGCFTAKTPTIEVSGDATSILRTPASQPAK